MKRWFVVVVLMLLVFTSVAGQEPTAEPDATSMPAQTDIPTTDPDSESTLSTPAPTDEATAVPATPVLTDEPTVPVTTVPASPSSDTPVPATTLPDVPTNVPPATEASTVEPTADTIVTDEPTAVPTLAPLPAVVWVPVFEDNFDIQLADAWSFSDSNWRYLALSDAEATLQLFDTTRAVLTEVDGLSEVALSAQVDVSRGTAQLFARSNGSQSYEVRLTPTGEVRLYRASTVLASASIDDFTPTTLHRLQLNVYDNAIWVSVDGETVVSVLDAAPLAAGQIGLAVSSESGGGEGIASFDDVTAYQPQGQVVLPTGEPIEAEPDLVLAPDNDISPDESAVSAALATEPGTIADGDTEALIAAMQLGSTQTIELAPGGTYEIDQQLVDFFGQTGLPVVRGGSDITINGNGAVLKATNPGYRIFAVDRNGWLTLSNLTVRDAQLQEQSGAGLLNLRGTVQLDGVRFLNNYAVIDNPAVQW